MIGAAIAVGECLHFHLAVVVHRLSPAMQRRIDTATNVLIAGFGLLVAWLGGKLAIMNHTLTSPALEFSLAWLYIPACIGGVLMAIYAVREIVLRRPLDTQETAHGQA